MILVCHPEHKCKQDWEYERKVGSPCLWFFQLFSSLGYKSHQIWMVNVCPQNKKKCEGKFCEWKREARERERNGTRAAHVIFNFIKDWAGILKCNMNVAWNIKQRGKFCDGCNVYINVYNI